MDVVTADEHTSIKLYAKLADSSRRILGYVPAECIEQIASCGADTVQLVDVKVLDHEDGSNRIAQCEVTLITVTDVPTVSDAPVMNDVAVVSADAPNARMNFIIKGVTFDFRQKALSAIAAGDPAFANCTFALRERVWQDTPAFAVVAILTNGKEHILGMVPAELVDGILKIYDEIDNIRINVYGGKDGKNYGARCFIN